MAYVHFATPPNVSARYERLSGGRGNRAVIYLAARKLGIDWDTWQHLPWWVQQAYIEGFVDEELLEIQSPGEDDSDLLHASAGTLATMGLQVIKGGRADI